MDLIERLVHLRQEGEPVALATVVASRRPASARPGDRALVLANGDLLGWVGGSCAQPAVQREGLRALADGQPRLIRLSPEAGLHLPQEGVVDDIMTCHSGGTLEIYVEPFLPAPWLLVTGDSPIAEALAQLGALDDFRVRRELPGEASALGAGERYVVVAGLGSDDEAALERALGLDPSYLAFVGSRKRLAEVIGRLRERGLPPEQLERIKGPAGLDIGATTAVEIAISILAEVIQLRRRGHIAPPPFTPVVGPAVPAATQTTGGALGAVTGPAVPVATDPVCGMQVAVQGARHFLEHNGERVYFCCPSCRRIFSEQPGSFQANVALAASRSTTTPDRGPSRADRGPSTGEDDALPG